MQILRNTLFHPVLVGYNDKDSHTGVAIKISVPDLHRQN